MKKRILIYLLSAILIVLLTLIVIQGYLMQESIRTSEAMFKANVTRSMEEVFNQINKINMRNYLMENNRYRLLRYRRIENINSRIKKLREANPELFICRSNATYFSEGRKYRKLSESDSNIIVLYNELRSKRDMLRDTSASFEQFINEMMKYVSACNVFDNKTINYKMLDTLIYKKLKANDIFIEPYIGVLDFSKTKLLYVSDMEYSGELFSTPFVFEYSPGGLRSAKVIYISLYFPSSVLFLNNNIYRFVLISFLLTLMIVFVFIMLVRLILQQQKWEQMKTDFVSNMTHEVKTPIATISLACEMLQIPETRSDPEVLQTYLHIISEENKRLRGLIEVVLQQSKMTDKSFSIKREKMDVHEIIRDAIETVSFIISNRKGKVEVDLKAKDPVIIADKLHITNLIYNLVDNAVKYSPYDLEIKIATMDDLNGIHVIVSDKGLGISKDKLNRIFDKFYRVSTGDLHNVKGFGIGLSYVKEIVNSHKGKIEVESELGKGSSFDVYLPRT